MGKIFVIDLKEGMITNEDIVTDSGVMVIPHGVALTQPIIDHLIMLGIPEIDIDENASSGDNEAAEANDHKQERKVHFEELRHEYDGVKDELDNAFGNIVNGKLDKAEMDSVVNKCYDFFDSNNIGADVINMLYSMHGYSDTTYMHCMNVGMISALIGTWLGWSEENVRLLNACGLFHDVGKLLVPKEIIDKKGRLTEEEFAIMREHPANGYRLLKNSDMDEHILNAAIMHHERNDGSGYPFGLTEERIDPFAQIVAIADVYEAMTARRSYHEPICPFDVIAQFEEEGLTHFNTKYLLTFIQHIADAYLHSHVILNNGESAEIVLINKTRKSKPLVITTSGRPIDLARELDYTISSVETE